MIDTQTLDVKLRRLPANRHAKCPGRIECHEGVALRQQKMELPETSREPLTY
jgi:hypothetical protein